MHRIGWRIFAERSARTGSGAPYGSGRIGALESGGVNRQALSDEDIAARKLLIDWARKRGYAIETDAIANLYIRRRGRDNDALPVATGSHIDTQPLGGKFDGTYGVLAGCEVLESLDDAGIETDHPITVVAWTNEEGSRFAPGAMGSLIYSGLRKVEEFRGVVDAEGTTLDAALDATLAAMNTDRRLAARPPFKAYIEAHIEQGPVLEARDIEIGAVTRYPGHALVRSRSQRSQCARRHHADVAPGGRMSAAIDIIPTCAAWRSIPRIGCASPSDASTSFKFAQYDPEQVRLPLTCDIPSSAC